MSKYTPASVSYIILYVGKSIFLQSVIQKRTNFNVTHRFMLHFYFHINNSGAQDSPLNLPVRYNFTIMFTHYSYFLHAL